MKAIIISTTITLMFVFVASTVYHISAGVQEKTRDPEFGDCSKKFQRYEFIWPMFRFGCYLGERVK